MNKMLRLPVALAFALGASNVLALGLGQVQVKSSLNQPLLAEIPILENAPGEAAELQVRLAPAESFARIGLERPSGSLLSALKFEVVSDAGGKPVIRVTTPNRINDPFLGLLIEVEWGRGKLLREYTLLLDPPVAVPSRAQPSQTAALPQGDVRPAPAENLATPPPMAAPRGATPAAPSLVPGESYGPVSEGDSLWKIASKAIPDNSVNINQMMIAIQRANPDAFIGGNINRLRTGAVLRIPSRDAIAAIGASEAAQQVREQTGEASLQPVEASSRPASSRPAAAAPADSRLAIVPPRGDSPARAAQSGSAADGRGAEMRADLARAREQGEALNQENRELRTRVQELEKIRGDSERLLELRNSELKALQQRLAEIEAQRAAAAAAAAETPAASAAPATTPKPMDQAAAPVAPVEEPAAEPAPRSDSSEAELETAAQVPESTEAAPPVPAPPVVEPEPAPAQPAPAVTPPAAAPAPAAAWYEDPLVLGGGGALVIGLLALFGLRGRGKKKAAAAAAGATGSRFEGTDFGVPSADDQHEDHAEAYDDGEERELLDRIAEQPDELERHLDLVRYYYGLNDASRFEGAVEAMYAQVFDPDEETWQQALVMGREMLPDHPLFIDQSSQQQPWEPIEDSEAPSTGGYDSRNYANDAAATGDRFAQPSEAEHDEPEFRVDLSEPELDVPEIERSPELEAFSFDKAPPAEPAPEPKSTASGASDAGLSLDLVEAAATKLELARAYLDMGDVEGARGMLEEVALEGTTEQRADAKRLLQDIR